MASKPKYINCFTCGSLKLTESEKLGSLCAPNNKLEEWWIAIGKIEPKPLLILCDAHFSEDEIMKGRVVGGIFHPNKLWRLKKDALPKFFLGKPFCYKLGACWNTDLFSSLGCTSEPGPLRPALKTLNGSRTTSAQDSSNCTGPKGMYKNGIALYYFEMFTATYFLKFHLLLRTHHHITCQTVLWKSKQFIWE